MLNEVKIATPISNLFSEIVDANKIIEVSNCLECRDMDFKRLRFKQIDNLR